MSYHFYLKVIRMDFKILWEIQDVKVITKYLLSGWSESELGTDELNKKKFKVKIIRNFILYKVLICHRMYRLLDN